MGGEERIPVEEIIELIDQDPEWGEELIVEFSSMFPPHQCEECGVFLHGAPEWTQSVFHFGLCKRCGIAERIGEMIPVIEEEING